jgi:tRNA threonylcarbamoyladenosine biosynthesis protein TsaB
MKILGLDCATMIAGIAILDDDQVLAEARHDQAGRTADLLRTIEAVCSRAGVAPIALDAIAIGAGPGSFTGLRIGMATGKGIAFATGRPLWAVSSLAALAYDGVHQGGGEGHENQLIAAVLDARRGEVFAGCYDARDLRPLGTERVFAPGALAPWLSELAGSRPIRCVGDALTAYPTALAMFADRWFTTTPSGVAVAQLARIGERVDALINGGPAYIRPSEAEVMYPDGVPGALPKRP